MNTVAGPLTPSLGLIAAYKAHGKTTSAGEHLGCGTETDYKMDFESNYTQIMSNQNRNLFDEPTSNDELNSESNKVFLQKNSIGQSRPDPLHNLYFPMEVRIEVQRPA